MKRISISFILLIFLTLFLSCSKDSESNPVSNEQICQIVLAWVEYDNSYWDDTGDSTVYIPNAELEGVVIANEPPDFNYFKIGNLTFSTKPYFNYSYGYLYFEHDDQPLLSQFNPVSIEVSTSLGKISGSLTLPDTIQNINLSTTDTLQIGQSFTISWTGSNADFYNFNCGYEWRDAQGNWHYKDLDSLLSGTSITFDGSIFLFNGKIDIWNISPINGPFPQKGAKPNMNGDGKGFMYYTNDFRDLSIEITVGQGLYNVTNANKKSIRHGQKFSRNIIESIKRRLGLSTYRDYKVHL